MSGEIDSRLQSPRSGRMMLCLHDRETLTLINGLSDAFDIDAA